MKHLLTGLTVPQQYVCVPLEDFQEPLSVFLTTGTRDFFIDVSTHHVMLGYKPLIIAVMFSKPPSELFSVESICLNFCPDHFSPDRSWKGLMTNDKTIARLILKKIGERKLNDQHIFFYEGQHGEHSFLNNFHQLVNRLREKLRSQDANNLDLKGNLYDQVRIAYAVPRRIALITVGDGQNMNMFPTDLHGFAGEDFYMSSLRHGGKANEQVENSGKLVISYMPVSVFREVYALGKNHMHNLSPATGFQVHHEYSKVLDLPVPKHALVYVELKRIDSFDKGVHRIHIYDVVYKEKIAEGSTLAHIHQYYVQWRINHGMKTNMLFR